LCQFQHEEEKAKWKWIRECRMRVDLIMGWVRSLGMPTEGGDRERERGITTIQSEYRLLILV